MFLKNKNIIFKIRRSKVTDYAALSYLLPDTDKLFLLYYALYRGLSVKCRLKEIKFILLIFKFAILYKPFNDTFTHYLFSVFSHRREVYEDF